MSRFLSTEKVDDLESQRHLTVTSPSPSSPHSRTSTILADDEKPAPPQAAYLRDEKEGKHHTQRLSAASTSTLANDDVPHVAPPPSESKSDANAKRLHATGGSSNSPRRTVIERSSSSHLSSPNNNSSPDLPPPHEVDEKAARYKVDWEGPDDPANPYNWSRSSRWYYTSLGSMLVFNATFASSSPGGIVEKVMKDFGFSLEVATLMISLFLAGYCVGPLFWGPLSEIWGRKPVFVVSFLLYTGFQVGCALSPNTGAILGEFCLLLLSYTYAFPHDRRARITSSSRSFIFSY